MRKQTLSAIFISALACMALGVGSGAAALAPNDGLIQIHSRSLDEFFVRPDADFQRYHKVIVDPAEVALRKGWLKSINATRGPSRWLVPEDARNITDNAAASLSSAVAESFRTRGFEVVTAPDAGVLRVSLRATDMVVNAPDVASAYPQALFNVDAGEATLAMEVRDATSGTLLGRVVDRGTARELSSRIDRAFSVTNQFWFDALFRQWAANCIRGFESVHISN